MSGHHRCKYCHSLVERHGRRCHCSSHGEHGEHREHRDCVTELIGPMGPIGPPGIGIVGPTGPPGDYVEGPRGECGYTGHKGECGSTGPTGQQGMKGDDGRIGPTGPTGQVGMQGLKGNDGRCGDTGPTGPTGQVGMQGLKGNDGRCGDTGPTGQPGECGLKGNDGRCGDTGPTGPTGPSGQPGECGLKGNDGRCGDTGPTGPTGYQGMQGQKGNDGQRGDTGPTGQSGTQGQKGDDGQQGMQGQKGDDGQTGPTGSSGTQGMQGHDGQIGPTGPSSCPPCPVLSLNSNTIPYDSTSVIATRDHRLTRFSASVDTTSPSIISWSIDNPSYLLGTSPPSTLFSRHIYKPSQWSSLAYNATAAHWNGSLWLIAASSSLFTSTDGRALTSIPSPTSSYINAITHDGQSWIVVTATTLYVSTDLLTWNSVNIGGNRLFVTPGIENSTKQYLLISSTTINLASSLSGLTTSTPITVVIGYVNDAVWNGVSWAIVGDSLYELIGATITNRLALQGNSIAYNGSWYIVASNQGIYKLSGSISSVNSQLLQSSSATDVVWTGNEFYIATTIGSYRMYQENLVNISLNNYSTRNYYPNKGKNAVACNPGWLTDVAFSLDGITWYPVTLPANISSICWNGSIWLLATTTGVYSYSPTAVTLSDATPASSIVATVDIAVAGGNSLRYSINTAAGLQPWQNCNYVPFGGGVIDVVKTPTTWIAAGMASGTNDVIRVSMDGINWSTVNIAGIGITDAATALATCGDVTLLATTNGVYRSDGAGTNWLLIGNPANIPIIKMFGSGSRWVALGRGLPTLQVGFSDDDGSNWLPATTNSFVTPAVADVKYDGYRWLVAAGGDSLTSIDGSNWVASATMAVALGTTRDRQGHHKMDMIIDRELRRGNKLTIANESGVAVVATLI